MCDTERALPVAAEQLALDDLTATDSSVLEFLNQEQRCLLTARSAASSGQREFSAQDEDEDDSELDIESIFEEIQRLSGGASLSGGGDGQLPDRSLEEILGEAERLIGAQELEAAEREAKRLRGRRGGGGGVRISAVQVAEIVKTSRDAGGAGKEEATEVETETEEEEELNVGRAMSAGSNGRATMSARSGAKDEADKPHNSIEPHPTTTSNPPRPVEMPATKYEPLSIQSTAAAAAQSGSLTPASFRSHKTYSIASAKTPSLQPSRRSSYQSPEDDVAPTLVNPEEEKPQPNSIHPDQDDRGDDDDADECTYSATGSESPFSESSQSLDPATRTSPPAQPLRTFCDRSTSPHEATEPPATASFCRERALELACEELRETLKDTEERLHAMRLQYDSLSEAHRDLRETHSSHRAEADRLHRNVTQLHECTEALRTELMAARADREEALRVQRQLSGEVTEAREQRAAALAARERDARTVQDLQRQCREMERILMRKHPDSVSALIVASKNPANGHDDQAASRRLLEQRIAQLEADAREQDTKAQQILANVQSRFSTVQSKYEQHIGDLETQVISLQQINARLNEKIAAHLNRNHQITASQACQTVDIAEHDTVAELRHCAAQTDAKITGLHRSTVASQIPTASGRKSAGSSSSSAKEAARPDCCQHAGVHNSGRDEAHLMATLRGMRIDLAIKEKAMQRVQRDLDESKRVIKKLQREKEALLKGSRRVPPAAAAGQLLPVHLQAAAEDGSAAVEQQPFHLRSSQPSRPFGQEPESCSIDGNSNGNGNSCNGNGLGHQSNGYGNGHNGTGGGGGGMAAAAKAEASSVALKEYLNRIKLLEFDYNALHDKRLQDLKTLQAAHERELASCQATVQILQHRLTERDSAFDHHQKRLHHHELQLQQHQQQQQQQQQHASAERRAQQQQQQHPQQQQQPPPAPQSPQPSVPVDYMALKAKVSSLERRHCEREQRLHILVDALAKGGRLTGTPFGSSCTTAATNSRSSSQLSAIPIAAGPMRDKSPVAGLEAAIGGGCNGGRNNQRLVKQQQLVAGSHHRQLPVRKCNKV